MTEPEPGRPGPGREGRHEGHSLVARSALVTLLLLSLAPSARSQTPAFRAWATSSVRFVEVRPIVADGEGSYTVGPVESSLAGSQDLSLTAWGFGVQGLSFTTLARARADLAGEFVFPRSDDRFDLLVAYAQLDRAGWRVRAGRQRTSSGLGFTGFDGAAVAYGIGRLDGEVFGGRSLARALNEPRNEALAGLVDFLPDQGAWLVGGRVGVELPRWTTLGARYQREILSDRSGLVSERAALDVHSLALRPLTVDLALDFDLGFDRLGKGSVAVGYAVPGVPLQIDITGRRYVPYFEMTTIWGFFEPVAYHEVMGRASWQRPSVSAWVGGGWRRYDDAGATTILDPLEDDAWQLRLGGAWQPEDRWSLEGRYDLLWGVGGLLNSTEVTVRFRPHPRVELAAFGTSFQQIEEFRVGDGRTLGGGLTTSLDLGERVAWDAGWTLYRHDPQGAQVDERWNQNRAWSALRFAFGVEPGRSVPRLRR